MPVPRIVGRAVDVVVALPVAEAERHIGLAENDGAGALEARHRERVFLGDEILERRDAPGGRQSGDVEGFLDRHRHAEERPALAPRQCGVRFLSRLPGAREIAHRHSVEIAVKSLDPGDELVGQLERGDLSVRQGSASAPALR